MSVSLYLASCSPAISSPNWYTAEAANRSGGAAEQPFDPHGACHSDGAPKSLAGSGLQVACGKLFGDMFAVMPGCYSSTKVSLAVLSGLWSGLGSTWAGTVSPGVTRSTHITSFKYTP